MPRARAESSSTISKRMVHSAGEPIAGRLLAQRAAAAIKKIYSARRSFRYCRARTSTTRMLKISEGAALVPAQGMMAPKGICFFAFAAMAGAAHADDFPPGPAHDLVAKACTQCHDGGMV